MSTNNLTHNNTLVIEYRTPSLAELVLTQHLFHHIIGNNFPMFANEAIAAYKNNWTIDKLEERLKTNKDLLLLAWKNHEPIGLVSGSYPEGGVGTVVWLLVKSEYQNKDIGSKLLAHACQYYKDLGCHKLKLTAPSEKARDFYLKKGMLLEGFHPAHWWQMDFWALGLCLNDE